MSSNNTGTGTAVQASGSANTAPGAATKGPTSKAGASISIFGLILLNVTAVISLNNLPSEAEYGLSSVCYFVFAAIFFLIPVAMVAAELATGWPERGGVFRWVGEAFKGRFGLMAMFLAFVEVCVFLPTTLTFAAVSITYVNPDEHAAESLASNKFVIVSIVLIVYWIAAFIVVAIVVSGTLIVAYVVPQKDINLTQAILTTYFDIFHWAGVPWLGPVVAVMLAIGVLVNATTWAVGPSTGLLAAAKAGYLPKPLQRTNKHGPPVTILMIQSGLVTVLMFTAAIRLLYSQPDRPTSPLPAWEERQWTHVAGRQRWLPLLADRIRFQLHPSRPNQGWQPPHVRPDPRGPSAGVLRSSEHHPPFPRAFLGRS